MSSGIDYYYLQAAKDDLQNQIDRLEREVEMELDSLRRSGRDSFSDIRAGLAELSVRITRLEEQA